MKILYTDGGCRPNPGNGAWVWCYIIKDSYVCSSGFVEEQTTSNRMELTAVIEGLKYIKEPSEICLYTDSTYVMGAVRANEKWLAKPDVPNRDLVEVLRDLLVLHKVHVSWVKGHGGDKHNAFVDGKVNEVFRRYNVSRDSFTEVSVNEG
jgi:ribonuclease HI